MGTAGIVTFHRALNYGAVLQAFALQRTINRLGTSCRVIDYRRPLPEDPYCLLQLPRNRSALRHNILTLLNLRSCLAVRERFKQFRTNYLTLTAESYRVPTDLLQHWPVFESYVTGSDQVWHPQHLANENGRIFYLESVPGRRVAYAPSFGVAEVPEDLRAEAATLLQRFEFLSSREESGCRIIRDLTGRDAKHVVDPTLLLCASDYDKVAVDPSQDEPYILLYPMQSSASIRCLALQVRKELKMPLIAVVPVYHNPNWFSFADRVIFDAGPAEFLGWVRKAEFVCTNSFHGTAFAIIYKKAFLSVPHHSTNSRSYSLLQCCGLTARQLADPKELLAKDCALIEYDRVLPLLDVAREQSVNYLVRALE